jgi:hypothetical protein
MCGVGRGNAYVEVTATGDLAVSVALAGVERGGVELGARTGAHEGGEGVEEDGCEFHDCECMLIDAEYVVDLIRDWRMERCCVLIYTSSSLADCYPEVSSGSTLMHSCLSSTLHP